MTDQWGGEWIWWKKFPQKLISRRSGAGLDWSVFRVSVAPRTTTAATDCTWVRVSRGCVCSDCLGARARARSCRRTTWPARVVCPAAGGTRTSLMLRGRPTEHVCAKNHRGYDSRQARRRRGRWRLWDDPFSPKRARQAFALIALQVPICYNNMPMGHARPIGGGLLRSSGKHIIIPSSWKM